MTGPYAQAAEQYWNAGWPGVLPLPYGRKKSPPDGYTGAAGVDPSYADIYTWATSDRPNEGGGNVALRMPRNGLGLDVDNYGNKAGAATLADAEQRWGPLPPTWRTTSRDDGISGIRMYRIPEGLHWPGELGPGTEIIQHGHRYAVAPPSLHPEGRTYRWISPDGIVSTTVPDFDTLPMLPEAWVQGLTGGELAREVARNNLTTGQTQQYLVARPGSLEQPCPRMQRAIAQATTDITTSSAHNGARDGALRVIRLADEGHPGVLPAIATLHGAFTAEATSPARRQRGEHQRSAGEAAREWNAIVESAVNLVTADPSNLDACDCTGQLTALTLTGPPPPTDGATALQLEPEPREQAAAEDRTTWWPKNLAGVLSGEVTEPEPEFLRRTDGAALFYRGKVNGLLGESESGKTWVALLTVAQVLARGGTVLYLDFEDTPAGIIARLRALGVTDEQLAGMHYVGPEETLHAAATQDLRDTITTARPELIVLDGFNAAMTLLGLDINDNGDATKFSQMLLRPLSDSGAAVVYVDHIPKAKENRGKGGIGAQAKRAMTTGCALAVDVITPFGRGMSGRLKLTVDKDRPGHVRAISAEAKRAGIAVLESDPALGGVRIRIAPPEVTTKQEEERSKLAQIKEDISKWLSTSPSRSSTTACRQVIRGDNNLVSAALAELIEGGFVEQRGAPGAGYTHHLKRGWTVADAVAGAYDSPPCSTVLDPAATVLPAGSGEAVEDRAAAPPPYRGGSTVPAPGDFIQAPDGTYINKHTGEIFG